MPAKYVECGSLILGPANDCVVFVCVWNIRWLSYMLHANVVAAYLYVDDICC